MFLYKSTENNKINSIFNFTGNEKDIEILLNELKDKIVYRLKITNDLNVRLPGLPD